MKRFIIPLIALILFFLEPVFSLFSPIEVKGLEYVLVPRFVIVYLIFTAVYYNRKRAIVIGFVLGLLYDMYHIDIIGVYTFLYPLVCYLGALLIRQIHRHIATVMFLSVVLIIILELLSYFFASLIALTSIGLEEFIARRLVPTTIANSVYIGMFGWLFKNVMTRIGLEEQAGS